MFEICALLAQKKTPKARKASGPKIKPGARVLVYGTYPGVVVGKHPTNPRWWNVQTDARTPGEVAGFDRSLISVQA